jgi:hypothetical protein
MKLFGVALASALFIPASVFAQHEHPGADKLGTVSFETSCRPATRDDFNRAMALMHSFEFGPAIDSFNNVLAADPNCAVAYWGIALSQWSNPFSGLKSGPLLGRGLAAVEKGLATGTPTPREKAYLNAVHQLYRDASTISHRDRTLAYAKAMEGVQREYREDIEARIFYALALDQTALPSDKTYAVQLQAAEILEPLWKKYPDHPGWRTTSSTPTTFRRWRPRAWPRPAATRRSRRRRRTRCTCPRTRSRVSDRGRTRWMPTSSPSRNRFAWE